MVQKAFAPQKSGLLAMRAVVLQDDGVCFRRDYPDPRPGPGETVVRVLSAGICETDLQLIRGYMGFRGVLGIDEVTIVGSRCGPFSAALLALRERQVDVSSLVDGTFPLEQAEAAFARARTEPVLKLILDVDESSANQRAG
jgi:threonine dehydrogenase-like Zn-dependent dehydrogenase